MANTINLQTLIAQEANNQGVPPAIALAVAQQESSFNPNARGAAGEIGLFQLMPKTAASLGVDPTDINQNVSGGISFLAQLFQKYGSWASALSAYNSGSPTGSPDYASSVLSKAGNFGLPPDAPVPSSYIFSLDPSALDAGVTGLSSTALIVGGVALVLGLLWWMD